MPESDAVVVFIDFVSSVDVLAALYLVLLFQNFTIWSIFY